MLLGCIGDDLTGSTDLANTLVKQGMQTTQYCGIPTAAAEPGVEAGVVALKSRTAPVGDAVAISLQAVDWLKAQGCRQFFFKYCSTFDSTPEGNIGPVIDALMDRLGADCTIVCPAFPATGRSVFQGYLFVNDRLLSESGMEHHPLTPMTDPDLRRWVGYQSKKGIGHVAATTVFQGAPAIRQALAGQVAAGRPVVVVDAIRDDDLLMIGLATRDLALVTGGSGVALGLPGNFRVAGLLADRPMEWVGTGGPAAMLSGSCSNMTRKQVAAYAAAHPAFEITPDALLDGTVTPEKVMRWVSDLPSGAAPLIYSSAEPAAVKAVHKRHGRDHTAAAIENSSPRRRAVWSPKASSVLSLPVARRPVRWSKGSAFRRSPSGRRSHPACQRSRPRTGRCGWRSSPVTSAPNPFSKMPSTSWLEQAHE